MIKKIRKTFNQVLARGFFRNSFFRLIHTKVFWRNRYVLFLVFSIIALNVVIWFLWVGRVMVSGFSTESYLNFILNIPWIPRTYSLLFINYFISLVNLCVSFFIHKKSRFSSYTLLMSTVFLNISIIILAIYYIVSLKL